MGDLISELVKRVAVDIPDGELVDYLTRYHQVSFELMALSLSRPGVLTRLRAFQYTEDLVLSTGIPFSRLYSEYSDLEEGCEDCHHDTQPECSITSDCTCVEYTGEPNLFSICALY
jgi:hypothetical protein